MRPSLVPAFWVIGSLLAAPSAAAAATHATGAPSPAVAARVVVTDELAGHWTAACSYFMPNFYRTCQQATAKLDARHFRLHGSVVLHQTVRKDAKALVAVTGHVCPPSGEGACQGSNDPAVGMPGPNRSFAAAFAAAANPNSNSFSPIPCIETGGRWYVDASPPS